MPTNSNATRASLVMQHSGVMDPIAHVSNHACLAFATCALTQPLQATSSPITLTQFNILLLCKDEQRIAGHVEIQEALDSKLLAVVCNMHERKTLVTLICALHSQQALLLHGINSG